MSKMHICRLSRSRQNWYAVVVGSFVALAFVLAGCGTSEATATQTANADTTLLPMPTPTGTRTQTTPSKPTQDPTDEATPTGTPSTPPADIPAGVALKVIGQLGGQSNAIALDGDIAYLGVGPRVLALDVSTPDQPRLKGQSDLLPGTVQDIIVVNDLAYVAAADAGIRLLNVADPSNPIEIANLPTEADAQAITVDGHLAFVVEERCDRQACTGALGILDVSDSSAMRQVGRIELPARGHYSDILDETTVVVAHDEGLLLVDLSDPTQPRETARLPLPGPAEDVLIVDNYAYVASYGLRVADLTDPAAPRLLDAPESFGIPLLAVDTAGGHVLVADSFCEFGHCGATLRALDVSDPEALYEVGLLTMSDAIEDLTVRNGLAFLAARRTGLYIADLSDPTQMAMVGTFNTLGNVASVAREEGFAYLTDGGSEGLQVIDITEPEAPERVGALASLRFATDMWLSDGLAYVPVWLDGFRTIDITNPAQLREIGALSSDQVQGTPDRVALTDGTAYLTAAEDGLKVLDVSDPAQPELVGSYNPSGSLRAVAALGEHVYVIGNLDQGDQREGVILVLDAKDRSRPTEIARVTLPIGSSSALALNDTHAYVAHADCYYFDCSGGLHVIDITDPSQPHLVGSLELPGGGFDVAVADGYVYVAAGDAGVWVVDASNPASPQPAGVVDTPGRALALSISDDLLSVADDSGGLVILQLIDSAGQIGAEPPPALLEISGRAQRSGIGTHCWSTPLGDGNIVITCRDMVGVPTAREPLPAASPFTAQFRLPIAELPQELTLRILPVTENDEMPAEVSAYRWWPYKASAVSTVPLVQNPEVELLLNPGLYVLGLFARWDELGDVTYGFLVDVKP